MLDAAGALARVSNKLPFFVSCIVLEAFSLPAQGFGHRARNLGARPGSLDQEKRTLTGQRGRINDSTSAQAGKSSVNPRPCCEAGRYLVQKKAFYKGGNRLNVPAGVRPRPATTLGGSQFCGKESSSPDPKSGEQWMPFGKVNLLPGGKRIQGARKPSAMLSADICLCVCLQLSVFVCVPALSLVLLLLKSLKTSEVLCLYRFSERLYSCI